MFTAKNDIRYYLNGINLEVWPTMENGLSDGRLVATDGHRLGIFKLENLEAQTDQVLNIIIPNDLLAGIKPGLPVTITIGPGDTVQTITVTQGASSYSGQAIDGKFPDYRRIFPSKLSGESAQFNPRFIADLGKAAKLFHGAAKFNEQKVTVSHNGLSAAIAGIGCDKFIAVIMPMRSDVPTVAPAWATEVPETVAEVSERIAARAAAIELAQAA